VFSINNLMFGAFKDFIKKIIDDVPPKVEENNSEDTFEPSQIEILPERPETESVIKKSKKRSLKYRK